jgi:galactonate dehydratase
MRITDIRAFPLWFGRNQLIVKVETDDGTYGLGESGLSGREKAVMGALEHFRELLVGQDPMAAGAIWQRLYRSQYFEGGRVLTAAQSAIDIALYDIKGKVLGVPVFELLGGKHRDLVPCFISMPAPETDEEVTQTKQLVQDGWRCLRLGRRRQEAESKGIFEPRDAIGPAAEALTAARRALGTRVTIGIDFHHRLTVAETVSFCKRMPRGTIDFLEEPIRAESPEAYLALRRMIDVPLAIGEEFSSKWQFLPFIEEGLTDFARIDVCNVGGFTEAMKVAGWAEAHYIDIMPHNPLGPVCTAASIHLCAAAANVAWLESRVGQYADDAPEGRVFRGLPQNRDGYFPVPTAPGLGVTLQDELEDDPTKRGAFRYWNPPTLRRRDGSVTNW